MKASRKICKVSGNLKRNKGVRQQTGIAEHFPVSKVISSSTRKRPNADPVETITLDSGSDEENTMSDRDRPETATASIIARQGGKKNRSDSHVSGHSVENSGMRVGKTVDGKKPQEPAKVKVTAGNEAMTSTVAEKER
jgi:hypothetical protein